VLLAEDVAAELDPASAGRWAVRICAFTGAWGVLTGFAVFILVRTGDFSHPLNYALGLCVAAGASFVVEGLRESVRGEIVPHSARRIGHVAVTVLTLVVFELFILAAHNAVDISSHADDVTKLRNALLGPSLVDAPGALRDLIVLALLWLIPGAAVGWYLGLLVVNERSDQPLPERTLCGGRTGVLVAVIAAPLAVFAYVLLWRLFLALKLAITAPTLWAAHYSSVISSFSHGFSVAGPPAVVIEGGAFAVFGLINLWLWSAAGKAICFTLLALVLAIGVRFKEWRPFGILIAGFLVGVVAPLFADFLDVAKLALLAAGVWLIPGLVLGLAAPLLDRPSDRANWWSAIATALGVIVAVLTALRWQYLGSQNYVLVVVALAFFGVALLFTRFHDLQEFWPALALCLSAIATGLAFLLVNYTVSFHGVLTEVSTINSLPASIAPSAEADQLSTDLRNLDFFWNMDFHVTPRATPALTYENALGAVTSLSASERQATIDAQRPGLVELRARAMNELLDLAAAKRRYIAPAPLADSLDGVASLSGAALDAKLTRDENLAIAQMDDDDRRARSVSDLVQNAAEIDSKHWETYHLQVAVIGGRLRANDRVLADLAALQTRTSAETKRAVQEATFDHSSAPEQLEVALAGSFAFWVTVGLLSAWAIRRRATPEASPPVDG
jgi:hypothetical protein